MIALLLPGLLYERNEFTVVEALGVVDVGGGPELRCLGAAFRQYLISHTHYGRRIQSPAQVCPNGPVCPQADAYRLAKQVAEMILVFLIAFVTHFDTRVRFPVDVALNAAVGDL